jgi:hypothetical protein
MKDLIDPTSCSWSYLSAVIWQSIEKERKLETVSRTTFSFHNGFIFLSSSSLLFCLSNQHPCYSVVVCMLLQPSPHTGQAVAGRASGVVVFRGTGSLSPREVQSHGGIVVFKEWSTSLGEKVVACAEAAPSSELPASIKALVSFQGASSMVAKLMKLPPLGTVPDK